jgi:hypothetical protein
MSTLIRDLIPIVRERLIELEGTTGSFWSDDELTNLAILGLRDLWRSIVDLKQEHFCIIDTEHVTLEANATQLAGIPQDVHKIYMIEPRDLSVNGSNHGLLFKPLPYNNGTFQLARSKDPIDPTNDTIYYALRGAGSPVGADIIDIAPKVTSQVKIALTYIPTLGKLTADNKVPIPGEADNAIISWTVAYARAKERDDRSPDPSWLAVYATDKASLLQALGLRQYQDPSYVEALWQEYW